MAAFTAVIHYKTTWPDTRLWYSATGLEAGPWLEREWNSRTSPMGPFWVTLIISFDNTGLLFMPKCADSTGSDDEGPSSNCSPSWKRGNNYFIGKSGTYVLSAGNISKFSDDITVERDALGADMPPSTMRSRNPRHTLFLDIDGTLYGNNVMNAFVDLWDRHLALSGAVLAFNTGRGKASLMNFFAETNSILVPTVSVCRLGCSVFWFRHGGSWVITPKSDDLFLLVPTCIEDAELLDNLHGVGGWDIHYVLRKLRGELVMNPKIRARLSDPIGPVPRDQRLYVIAFRVHAECVGNAVAAVREKLQDIQFKISICGDGQERYLDVINIGGGKLGGMRHVLRCLGPAFPPEAAVMAGDSGNDLDALDHDGPEKGIIVGNAQHELLTFWKDLNMREPDQRRVVFAAKYCAEGIVEGLRMLSFA